MPLLLFLIVGNQEQLVDTPTIPMALDVGVRLPMCPARDVAGHDGLLRTGGGPV
jgi:hypothetical protein